jgi:FkbM family methyltransferase
MWKVPTPVATVALSHSFETIFDVGGNNGAWAEEAHRRWPRAKIVSFEPLPDIAAENEQRARDRWRVFNYGLADSEGPRWIQRNLSSPGASTMAGVGTVRRDVFGLDEKYREEQVDCHTLDFMTAFIEVERPALLKIDVEGAEMIVLRGGRKTIPNFDTVIVELNGPGCFRSAPSTEEVDAFMRDLSFQMVGSVGELRHPQDDSILQWDAVWVKR